jgi:hypothetical protein
LNHFETEQENGRKKTDDVDNDDHCRVVLVVEDLENKRKQKAAEVEPKLEEEKLARPLELCVDHGLDGKH